MKTSLHCLFILNLALVACAGVDSSDLASERRESNVPTTEATEGAIVGEFTAAAPSDQILVASSKSNIADTALIARPGALAVNAAITLQEGQDRGATLPAALGYDANLAILGGTPAVHFDNAEGANVVGSLALEIPIALNGEADTKEFFLQDATGSVGIYYVYRTDANTFKVGFEALDQDDVVGGFVRATAKGFGWYRLVYLSSSVANAEADTQDEPVPAD